MARRPAKEVPARNGGACETDHRSNRSYQPLAAAITNTNTSGSLR